MLSAVNRIFGSADAISANDPKLTLAAQHSRREVLLRPIPLHRISCFGRLITKLIWLSPKPLGRRCGSAISLRGFRIANGRTLRQTTPTGSGLLTDLDSNVAFPFCDWFALLKMLAWVIHSATGRRAKVGTVRLLKRWTRQTPLIWPDPTVTNRRRIPRSSGIARCSRSRFCFAVCSRTRSMTSSLDSRCEAGRPGA